MSFRRLGEILPHALEGLGIAEQVREARVRRAWVKVAPEVAGQLGVGSDALELRAGVLTVGVGDRHLVAALEGLQAPLVAALNHEMGERVVERLVFQPR
jgi:hypothetical protein